MIYEKNGYEPGVEGTAAPEEGRTALAPPTVVEPPAVASDQAGGRSNSDRFLFDLAPGWALGFDDLQWILLKRYNPGRGHRRWPWKGVSFIASEKRFLERVIREKRVPLTPEGRAQLNALPATFREFLATRR